MNRWIRRVSIAVATTAVAGGALLGAVGPASAATTSAPAEHARPAVTVSADRWYLDQLDWYLHQR
ncbi:hypothetical protein ACIQVL_18125 [Streptomyces sp. NPDC090499]|uniref:hypothetical protein n=1 Tax=unclassified Streptomyces TaxID=2593676 RepID=UPI00381C64A6